MNKEVNRRRSRRPNAPYAREKDLARAVQAAVAVIDKSEGSDRDMQDTIELELTRRGVLVGSAATIAATGVTTTAVE